MEKKYTLTLLGFLFCFLIGSTIDAQTFTNQLPIPPLVTSSTQNLSFYTTMHNFDPTGSATTASQSINNMVPTMCINVTGDSTMTYLGPTLVWETDTWVNFNIRNDLPGGLTATITDPALLPTLDSTTCHWHGMNLAADWDGGPHQSFPAGSTWVSGFPIRDSVQTLWYHSHLMNYTTEQVIWGLAGMVTVVDPNDQYISGLPHDYGVNDIPVVIQEKGFNYDTTVTPNLATSMYVNEKPGNGPHTILNGVVNAYQHVPNQVVRVRMLNGSPRKSFNIGFSTAFDTTNVAARQTFYQFGTDGGYMGQAYPTTQHLINPGERGEFLLNLTSFTHGDTLYMSNLVTELSGNDIVRGPNHVPGPPGPNGNGTFGKAFMVFVVDTTIAPQDPITTITNNLPAYVEDTGPVFKERTKRLQRLGSPGSHVWVIDSTGMRMNHLDDTVLVNAKEKWTIINETPIAHPFHIHKVQFQVIEYIEGTDTFDFNNLPNYLRGWKDVILVRKDGQATFTARFDSFPAVGIDPSNGFMYHCHILTHEDTAMMHQFTVVDTATYTQFFPVGLEEIFPSELHAIYPNPAGDVLFLKGKALLPGRLRITDILGRELRTTEIGSFEGIKRIGVADLPRGLVFVEWTVGNQQVTRKIFLE